MNKAKGVVAFLTLGCKVNTYETNAMQLLFTQAGYEITDFSKTADIYVVNTCSVTNMADRKSRQMLHKAKKMNPRAIVVAAGCYVQTKEAEALEDLAVDIIIGNNMKQNLADRGLELFWDEDLRKYLVKKAYSVTYGARNLRRTIQRDLEDPISEVIIQSFEAPVSEICIRVSEDQIQLDAK